MTKKSQEPASRRVGAPAVLPSRPMLAIRTLCVLVPLLSTGCFLFQSGSGSAKEPAPVDDAAPEPEATPEPEASESAGPTPAAEGGCTSPTGCGDGEVCCRSPIGEFYCQESFECGRGMSGSMCESKEDCPPIATKEATSCAPEEGGPAGVKMCSYD